MEARKERRRKPLSERKKAELLTTSKFDEKDREKFQKNKMAAADRGALLAWSRAFVETHGRRPTRADMPEDVGASELEERERGEEREREKEGKKKRRTSLKRSTTTMPF